MGVFNRVAGTHSETRIAGMKELQQALETLPVDLGKKVIYAAIGGAGSVVRKAAVQKVAVLDASSPMVAKGVRKPGTVKKAIRSSRSKINKGRTGLWEVIVRVKPLKKSQAKKLGAKGANNPNDPYYWWWLEFGTSKMAARPFLRPAFETTKSAQMSVMHKRMKIGLDKAAAAIAAKVNRAS